MSWGLLLAISIVTAVCSILMVRYILRANPIHPASFTILSNGSTGLMLLILALAIGYDNRWYLIPKLNLLLMIPLWAFANIFIMYSLQRVEASQFSVIFTTRVVWTILVSVIFLNEHLAFIAILGAFLLFFSSILALWEEGVDIKNKNLILCLIASLLFGVAVANDGIVLAHGYSPVSYFALAFGFPAIFLMLFSREGRRKAIVTLKKYSIVKKILLVGLLNAISAITIFFAFQKGKELSILASLNQTQTILIVLGAALLLKERRYFARRMVAAAVSFIGVLLVINAR